MILPYSGKTFFQISPKVDILCVQEHKLQGDALDTNLFRVWPRASSWAKAASTGYSTLNPIGGATQHPPMGFRSITVLCGIECEEYFVGYCQSHKSLVWI
jgi:hypothetical protein